MIARRHVKYGVSLAIGVAIVVMAIPSQQGLPTVTTNSPGILSGSGTPSNPLNATLTVDGVTMTGTGSAGSPLTAGLGGFQFALFGDGNDGASSPCGTIAVNTTLTRTIHCTSLTINNGVTLNPGGWRIFVNGTLTLNGKISASGGNASGTTGGAAGGNGYGAELCPGGGGGNANAGGGSSNLGFCGAGGFPIQPDECSNSGGAGAGAATAATAGGRCKGGGGGRGRSNGTGNGTGAGQVNPAGLYVGSWRAPFAALTMTPGAPRWGSHAQPFGQNYTGGTGGGGGGTGDFCCCNAGAGGGGGGVIVIAAREIVGTGSVESKGGNGSSGGAGGGGGGGGGGGVISIFIGTGSFPATDVTAGAAGSTGTGCFGQASAGANGGDGLVVLTKAGV